MLEIFCEGGGGCASCLVLPEHDGVPDDLLKVYTASGCMKVVESVLTVRTPTATIDFTPNFIGTKKFVVAVVNSNTLKLERGFLVFGKSEAPRITQKYIMNIPATDEAVRRTSLFSGLYELRENRYSKPIRSSKNVPYHNISSGIVKITDQLMSVPPMGKLPCEMFFVRNSHHHQNIETLLYISDAETYVQEEAYSLTLDFEAS
ncbi:Protein CBG23254 [Caenorhabditis briggsae]|uniref:Protein CBG23254 n=1 Tax=Caenorhabditis briggsae TaxID=6238 RepID=A8Y4C7_CAEBR|nr:Protein CBG23254 [Caenorhabditis briggsae]CAP39747.2 Protein CBG23254 [Caenorhabditis briggsae]